MSFLSFMVFSKLFGGVYQQEEEVREKCKRGMDVAIWTFHFFGKTAKNGAVLNTEQVKEGSKLLCRHIYAYVAGLVGGEHLKQFFSDVLVKVGQQVVLPCQSTTKESVTDLNFFWYRKLPGETLSFLLQAYETGKNDKYYNEQFSMTVYKNKSAPLEIAEVSLQDTAIYYCVLKHHLKLSQISVRTKSVTNSTGGVRLYIL